MNTKDFKLIEEALGCAYMAANGKLEEDAVLIAIHTLHEIQDRLNVLERKETPSEGEIENAWLGAETPTKFLERLGYL